MIALLSSLSPVPEEPAGPIKYTELTTDSVTVSWNPPNDDGGLPITEYTIDVFDTLQKSWMEVATVNKNTTSWTYNKLRQKHVYKFRIFASNEEGKSDEALESSEFIKPVPPSKYSDKLTLSSLKWTLLSLNLDRTIVPNRGLNNLNRRANSIVPDESAHYELSHQDLHCLQKCV